MSALYGTLSGRSKTTATRCGTRNYPIITNAASWAGCITVRVWIDDDGTERFSVDMEPWKGRGDRRGIAEGIVGRADSVTFSE